MGILIALTALAPAGLASASTASSPPNSFTPLWDLACVLVPQTAVDALIPGAELVSTDFYTSSWFGDGIPCVWQAPDDQKVVLTFYAAPGNGWETYPAHAYEQLWSWEGYPITIEIQSGSTSSAPAVSAAQPLIDAVVAHLPEAVAGLCQSSYDDHFGGDIDGRTRNYLDQCAQHWSTSFPWDEWSAVPPLGDESVAGSGCGLTDLGATLPDGWWYGEIVSHEGDIVVFQLTCGLYGDLARQALAECEANVYPGEEWICTNRFSPSDPATGGSMYPVESPQPPIDVVLSPEFVGEPESPDMCGYPHTSSDPVDPFDFSMWIQVVDGQLVYAFHLCPFG